MRFTSNINGLQVTLLEPCCCCYWWWWWWGWQQRNSIWFNQQKGDPPTRLTLSVRSWPFHQRITWSPSTIVRVSFSQWVGWFSLTLGSKLDAEASCWAGEPGCFGLTSQCQRVSTSTDLGSPTVGPCNIAIVQMYRSHTYVWFCMCIIYTHIHIYTNIYKFMCIYIYDMHIMFIYIHIYIYIYIFILHVFLS